MERRIFKSFVFDLPESCVFSHALYSSGQPTGSWQLVFDSAARFTMTHRTTTTNT